MIKKITIEFLEKLKVNNHKEWFDAHRKEYQDARGNFLEVVQQLIQGIAGFDPAIAESQLEARKCIMRINRDIRFSADKTPYKTNFFAFFNREGKKSPFAGYYLSVSPEDSFHGGGIYMPDNTVLAKIRQEIDYNPEDFRRVVRDKKLLEHYQHVKPSGQLTNPPKGYSKDHPLIDYLKYKGFYTQKMLSQADLQRKTFVEDTLHSFVAVKPLVKFVNRTIG